MCASSAPPIHWTGDDFGLRRAAAPAARPGDPAPDARSLTGAATAGAGSGRRGRGSRCRSRNDRSASALRTPAASPAPAGARLPVECFGERTSLGIGIPVGQTRVRVIHDSSVDDRRGDASAKRPAVERGVLRFRTQRRRTNGCGRVGRQDRDVRALSLCERPAGQVQHARGIHRQQLDHPFQPDPSRCEPADRSTIATAVSSPTIPNGARSNSTSFSSA